MPTAMTRRKRGSEATASLDSLIQEWRTELDTGKAISRAYDKAHEAATAATPLPALIRYNKSAAADGLKKPLPDFPNIAIHPAEIKRVMEGIRPLSAMKINTKRGEAILLLDKPKRLTAHQIAWRKRLQKRLEAAIDYQKKIANQMRERGFSTAKKHDVECTAHFARAWSLEKKIGNYTPRNQAELRTKIEFVLNHPEGAAYFHDGNGEFVEGILRDVLSLTVEKWVYTPVPRGKGPPIAA